MIPIRCCTVGQPHPEDESDDDVDDDDEDVSASEHLRPKYQPETISLGRDRRRSLDPPFYHIVKANETEFRSAHRPPPPSPLVSTRVIIVFVC